MGGIHRHRHTKLFHLSNAQHIDNQIIIAKTRAALAQDNLHIVLNLARFGDDICAIPRGEKLSFLNM